MEAKGCAQSMSWTNARRSFYWALRSKLALSKHISHIHHASPNLSYVVAEREIMNLLPSHLTSNPREKDSQVMAEALEAVDLNEVLHNLRTTHVANEMLSLVRGTGRGRVQGLAGVGAKAGLAGLVTMVDSLTTDEKAALVAALQVAATQEQSPGPPSYAAAA
jgi:acetyl-CoA carboxylase/biotin carboxylase 1